MHNSHCSIEHSRLSMTGTAVSRFTNDEAHSSEMAIVAEALMNNVG